MYYKGLNCFKAMTYYAYGEPIFPKQSCKRANNCIGHTPAVADFLEQLFSQLFHRFASSVKLSTKIFILCIFPCETTTVFDTVL